MPVELNGGWRNPSGGSIRRELPGIVFGVFSRCKRLSLVPDDRTRPGDDRLSARVVSTWTCRPFRLRGVRMICEEIAISNAAAKLVHELTPCAEPASWCFE
jgi:hypothetical protein